MSMVYMLELGVIPTLQRCRHYKIYKLPKSRWAGHLIRMTENEVLRKVLAVQLAGQRKDKYIVVDEANTMCCGQCQVVCSYIGMESLEESSIVEYY